MILIDALYINNGGGKVLLDYLMQELNKLDTQIFYLLDKRIENIYYPINEKSEILFLEPSYFKRKNFYVANKDKFSRILCFGNLPPNVRNNKAISYTYFHQPLYLGLPDNMPVKEQIMFWIKTKVLNSVKKNTDYWLVQSDLIKSKFCERFKIDQEKVLLMPFYPPFQDNIQETVEREKDTYVYISNASIHKNHIRLIDSFCKSYDIYKKGTLTLTVSEEFPELCRIINEKQKLGYPINNLGFIKRDELKIIYQSHEYLIFPSLAESFGLGLVEAIENGCKVIGADLPYTYAVCEPSIVFNPYDEKSMIDAFSLSFGNNIKHSVNKITNNIKQLINLLHGNTK
jgi:glycosyltransferase involved in cell wall biosynthesis